MVKYAISMCLGMMVFCYTESVLAVTTKVKCVAFSHYTESLGSNLTTNHSPAPQIRSLQIECNEPTQLAVSIIDHKRDSLLPTAVDSHFGLGRGQYNDLIGYYTFSPLNQQLQVDGQNHYRLCSQYNAHNKVNMLSNSSRYYWCDADSLQPVMGKKFVLALQLESHFYDQNDIGSIQIDSSVLDGYVTFQFYSML